jgi:hypothetical protein
MPGTMTFILADPTIIFCFLSVRRTCRSPPGIAIERFCTAEMRRDIDISMLQAQIWKGPAHLYDHVGAVWRLRGEGPGAPDWLLPDVVGADLALHLRGPDRISRGADWMDLPGRGDSRTTSVE